MSLFGVLMENSGDSFLYSDSDIEFIKDFALACLENQARGFDLAENRRWIVMPSLKEKYTFVGVLANPFKDVTRGFLFPFTFRIYINGNCLEIFPTFPENINCVFPGNKTRFGSVPIEDGDANKDTVNRRTADKDSNVRQNFYAVIMNELFRTLFNDSDVKVEQLVPPVLDEDYTEFLNEHLNPPEKDFWYQ